MPGLVALRRAEGAPGRSRVRGWFDAGREAARREPRLARTLVILFGLGALIRLWLMFAQRPAFVGYPDTALFLMGANGEPFWDQFRMVGYSYFLKVTHAVTAQLSFVSLVQHGLGMATALLLYLTVCRAGGPRWLGAIPAGYLLLGGSQIMIEHAILSETLFAFLVCVTLYLLVRYAPAGGHPGWIAVAGLAIGLAGTVRLIGLALIPPLGLWALLATGADWRRRVLVVAALLGGAAVCLGAYEVRRHDRTGEWGTTRTGVYNLYARVARFADCTGGFTPPRGTEYLCEEIEPAEREGPIHYLFEYDSPGVGKNGNPQFDRPTDDSLDAIRRWSQAAARGQPLDYGEAVGKDLLRYVVPGAWAPPGNADQTPGELSRFYVDDDWVHRTVDEVGRYSGKPGVHSWRGQVDALRKYEAVTSFQGPLAAVVLVLAALAPFLVPRRQRAVTALLAGTGFLLLVIPVLTLFYDYRFALPATGPLVAAAALGGWAVALRVSSRRRRGEPGTAAPAR